MNSLVFFLDIKVGTNPKDIQSFKPNSGDADSLNALEAFLLVFF